MTAFRKLLVANRGEIAIRVFRSSHELGIRTIAIYSHEDRFAIHRLKADEAYEVGKPGEPIRSYLNIEAIVELAKAKEVDAIHPGYGFLSENADFARACQAAGIVFVGPRPELLDQLGDKVTARKLAREAGIPVLAGSDTAVMPGPDAQNLAIELGFPVIVKASMGGGGRGMRVVESPGELDAALDQARREAGTAFGVPDVFIEKFVRKAKHIEVQILGDQHGGLVHLYERDCSVQRRHQKIVEMAPAHNLDPGVRQAVCDAAIKLGRLVRYENAGTVEFLVDVDSGAFYFIEVNPRIQVEHTVTEIVTNVDLVKSQILIAAGMPLSDPEIELPSQDVVQVQGYALQCRVTTEDPENKFTPDYGRITHFRSVGGLGIRIDSGPAVTGGIITPFYDSLLVKICASGRRFIDAARRMKRALEEFRVRGVKTNIPFLLNLVADADFLAGNCTTRFIDENPELFRFPIRQNRAMRLLTYAAEITVNGFPGIARPPGQAITPEPQPPRFEPAAPPSGFRQQFLAMGADAFSALGAAAAAPAPDRYHLSRRPPIAAGHPGANPRHAPRGRCLRSALLGCFLDRDVGRCDVRHGHALSQGRPLGTTGAASREDPQYPFSDAAARVERRRLHELPRQRRQGFCEGGRRGRHRPLPRLRLAQLGAQYGAVARSCPRSRGALRSGNMLHGRYPQSQTDQVQPGVLCQPGQGAREARCQLDRDQGHGGIVQAACRRATGECAAKRGRRSHPFPHSRYRRCSGGERALGSAGRPGRGRRRHRIDGRINLST